MLLFLFINIIIYEFPDSTNFSFFINVYILYPLMKEWAKILEILFKLLLVFHILGAICGLGAAFALPYIMNSGRNVRSAFNAHMINAKVERLAKIGSITLLVSGLIMGFIHPYLFTTGWYITSLVLYILTQPLVAYLLPRYERAMLEVLGQAKGDELPSEYIQIAKKTKPLTITTYVLLVLLVVLMVFKPF